MSRQVETLEPEMGLKNYRRRIRWWLFWPFWILGVVNFSGEQTLMLLRWALWH